MHGTLTAWKILGLGEGNCFQDYCIVPLVCHLVITARIACLFVFYFTMCLRLALNSQPSGTAAWATLPSFRSLCFKLSIFILKASYVLAVYLLVRRNSPCLIFGAAFFIFLLVTFVAYNFLATLWGLNVYHFVVNYSF